MNPPDVRIEQVNSQEWDVVCYECRNLPDGKRKIADSVPADNAVEVRVQHVEDHLAILRIERAHR